MSVNLGGLESLWIVARLFGVSLVLLRRIAAKCRAAVEAPGSACNATKLDTFSIGGWRKTPRIIMRNLGKPQVTPSVVGSFDCVRLRLTALRMSGETEGKRSEIVSGARFQELRGPECYLKATNAGNSNRR